MPTLNWLTRDDDIKAAAKVPYRLLEADSALSYGDVANGNLLIQGDNLEALKSLLPYYAGQVKCIYIDPPFNTGDAFDDYDDNVEHSVWLGLMFSRLVILRELLAPQGVIFIHLDNKENAYFRVVADEVFGRKNFLNMFVVKTSDPSGHKTVNPSPYDQSEHVFMYAKHRDQYRYEPMYVASSYDEAYRQIILNIEDDYNDWKIESFPEYAAKEFGFESAREARASMTPQAFVARLGTLAFKKAHQVVQLVTISDAAGRVIVEARNSSRVNPDVIDVVHRDRYPDVYITRGKQIYFYSNKIREVDGRMTVSKLLTNIWTDIPWNGIASEGGVALKNGRLSP